MFPDLHVHAGDAETPRLQVLSCILWLSALSSFYVSAIVVLQQGMLAALLPAIVQMHPIQTRL